MVFSLRESVVDLTLVNHGKIIKDTQIKNTKIWPWWFFRHKSIEKTEKLCLYFEMTPDDFIELGGKTYRWIFQNARSRDSASFRSFLS